MIESVFRPKRSFTPDELAAFDLHWSMARFIRLDIGFHGRIHAAVRACRTLFPGENITGYWRVVKRLIDVSADSETAMRELWGAPMPQTTPQQVDEARLAGRVVVVEEAA